MFRIFLLLLFLIYSESSFTSVKIADDLWQQANKEIFHIDTETLQKRLQKEPNLLLIDVRSEKETTLLGTIKAGQNVVIPRGWLEFRIAEHADNENTAIVVYCGLNLRSPLAAKKLMDMGYKNVVNYDDGYFAWQKADLPVNISDKAPESMLYRMPVEVIDGVFSAIGATEPATYQNSGHNNNLSFIIGDEAVLVFNAGGSYLLAKSLHEEIKKITDKPVKYVVLENAQGHAILGSNYWQDAGAIIIAHELALKVVKKHGEDIFNRSARVLKDKLSYSKIVLPEQTFSDKYTIDLGGRIVELLYLGNSHSPDDIQLWLAKEGLLISGDTAFNERMLPIFEHTNVREWLETWGKLVALKADIIIPGHGAPTDLETVTYFTKDYLRYIQGEIEKILDEGGDLVDAYNIDQSRFLNWDTYQELHLQNISRLFKQMEFE